MKQLLLIKETFAQFFEKSLKDKFLKKSVLFLFLANSSGTIFGLLSTVILTRLLSVEDYGKYSYVLYIISFFVFLSLPGMATAIMQSAANNFDAVLESGTRLRIKFSTIGSICILGVAWFSLTKTKIDVCIALLAGAVFFPFYISLNSYLYFLNGKRLYGHYFRFCIIENVLSFIVTVLIVILTKSFLATVTGSIAVKTAITGILYIMTIKYFKKESRDDPAAKRIGKHFSAVSFIGALGNNFDKIIIGTFISFSSLAIFNIADMIASQMKMMWLVIANYIFPVISKENGIAARGNLSKRMMIICGILICIAIVAIFFVTIFIPLCFSKKYIQSIFFAQLLIIAFVISAPGAVLSTYFCAQKMIRQMYIVKIFETISYSLSLLLLVPRYKLMGVVWSTIIARGTYSASSLFLMLEKEISHTLFKLVRVKI